MNHSGPDPAPAFRGFYRRETMISALFLCFLLGALVLVVFVLRPRQLFGNRSTWRPRPAFGGGNDESERRKPGMENGKALEERRKDDDVGGES
jgi:hypothetical protein